MYVCISYSIPEMGNRYFINSVATATALLNLIEALPQPFLNKNSSELSLPLLLLHFKEKFWSCFTDVGKILKNLTLRCFFVSSCYRKTWSEKI